MSIEDAVRAIDTEIERLQKARELLTGPTSRIAARPQRRTMSAAARKRIGDAARRRWAARKKADKNK